MENETNPGARNDDPCYYERPPMVEVRFWLVTVFGSSISLTSVLFNVFLFYLFASRRHHRSGQNVYLMLLAFFDVFVSGAYVALMSVNVLADYLVEPRLIKFWFSYMVPTITISHIAMTSSSFLIVAATFERYTITTNSALLGFAQRNRILIGGCAIALGLISKGSIFFEFDIHVEKECTGQMTEVAIGLHPFVHGTSYHVIWRFWYRNFVTVFAPFLVLSYFNICIVRSLSKQQCVNVTAQLAGNFAIEQAKRKASARAATRTMVAVVSCYLGSNIINVLLTVWEHVDKDSLSSQYVNVYAISVDCVSLLTTLACAMRLPIYIICQPALRAEINAMVAPYCCCVSEISTTGRGRRRHRHRRHERDRRASSFSSSSSSSGDDCADGATNIFSNSSAAVNVYPEEPPGAFVANGHLFFVADTSPTSNGGGGGGEKDLLPPGSFCGRTPKSRAPKGANSSGPPGVTVKLVFRAATDETLL